MENIQFVTYDRLFVALRYRASNLVVVQRGRDELLPRNRPRNRRQARLRRHRTDGHPERQGYRRLRGAPRAADRQAPAGRPVHLLRPHGAGDPAGRAGARRPPASAYRACHRHLSVRRQDQAPRLARHRDGHRAGRREPDDGRPRHRPFRAHARGIARRADVALRPADLAGAARRQGGGRAALREHRQRRTARIRCRRRVGPRRHRFVRRAEIAGPGSVRHALCRHQR